MRAGNNKALLLVGGPGSGKDIVLRTLFAESNVVEISLDQLYQAVINKKNIKVINEGKPLVVNGNLDSRVELVKLVLERMDYQTKLCIVSTSNATSKARNDARINAGQRTITEEIRFNKWKESTQHANDIRASDKTAIFFDNDWDKTNTRMDGLRKKIIEFFDETALDNIVGNFLDENFKNDRQAHKAIELSIAKDRPKTGLHAYHDYNSKKKTKAATAPVSPQSPESSEGAYLSTESKKFKDIRKQAKPPTNTQYVGDPQGVGGATADLREEKKPNKSKSAKPPAINADARVGDDQAVVTTLGMTGEQTELKRNLKKLREQITNKSPDGEFLEKENYEDIGLDGNKGIYEGRAIVTNKPFRRGSTYSVYVDKNGVVERMDFPNRKRVLEEIFDALTLEAKS